MNSSRSATPEQSINLFDEAYGVNDLPSPLSNHNQRQVFNSVTEVQPIHAKESISEWERRTRYIAQTM